MTTISPKELQRGLDAAAKAYLRLHRKQLHTPVGMGDNGFGYQFLAGILDEARPFVRAGNAIEVRKLIDEIMSMATHFAEVVAYDNAHTAFYETTWIMRTWPARKERTVLGRYMDEYY